MSRNLSSNMERKGKDLTPGTRLLLLRKLVDLAMPMPLLLSNGGLVFVLEQGFWFQIWQ